MPIPAQNEHTITFNAVYSPALNVNQSVDENGRLRTSIVWVGAPIAVDANGVYSTPGNPQTFVIQDVEALPEDLAHLQGAANAAFAAIAGLLHQINTIRKIV